MSLLTHLATIDDPRRDINKRHDLLDILFLTVSGVLSGAEGWKDIKDFGDEKLEWLRQYRPFSNGIPVDDTIARSEPLQRQRRLVLGGRLVDLL